MSSWALFPTSGSRCVANLSHGQLPVSLQLLREEKGEKGHKIVTNDFLSPALQSTLTAVSNVYEAAPISLFWAHNRFNELPEMRFEFPSNLIGKLTMACSTGQSLRIFKSWYTGRGPEQGFRRCFAYYWTWKN